MRRILIIDDDVDTCNLLSAFLAKKGFETDVAYSGNKGLQKFKSGAFDLIISDYRLGDKEGLEILKEAKQVNPEVRLVIITGYSDIKTAVKVIKEGAFDYISKPLIPEEVLNVIHNAERHGGEKFSANVPNSRGTGVTGISWRDDEYLRGEAPSIQHVYREVELVAPTSYSIILYGESGTGKEVIAKSIHRSSPRAAKPFVALDCGTLSKELAGSELFGHVKGAFTGALGDKTGHFEMANGGTLFLDEVANLSYDIQASLLRVIQERKFKRIGGVKEMDLDIRIIVASNENLEEAYHKGRFREDLFHRLNEFSIVLPPLRERKGDIPLFAHYFLEKVNCELGKHIAPFDKDVLDAFVQYTWPGNIRELKNVIRRASLLATKGKILRENLPWYNGYDTEFNCSPVRQESLLSSGRLQTGDDQLNLKSAASQAEFETVMNVLKQVNYNKSKAAVMLKIDRKTLYNKLKKFEEFFNGTS
jgi:two-component system response regulator HydG